MAIEKLPEEAYAVLDRLDEAMISSELAGLIEYGAQELIYSFKIEGREVTGLSWPGAKALARWMAEKGHPLDAEEKDITQTMTPGMQTSRSSTRQRASGYGAPARPRR